MIFAHGIIAAIIVNGFMGIIIRSFLRVILTCISSAGQGCNLVVGASLCSKLVLAWGVGG